MKTLLAKPRWSPYLVGTGIGVLSWITFAGMGKALWTSTTLVRANAYFAKYLVGKPGIEWQFALVVFLVLGAWLAARLSGSRLLETVPALWAERFGPSRAKRAAGAFVGGAILLFGARLAGGCTSGHALSGGMQLAISSWVFLASMFVAGVATALALYGRRT